MTLPENRLARRILVAGLATGVVVACLGIWLRPLWRDEVWTLFLTQPDLAFGGDLMRGEVHPPLYYYLIYIVRQVLDAEPALRLVNIVIFAIAAALSVREIKNKTIACIYVGISASLYWFYFYSTEIRSYSALYSLAILFTAMSWTQIKAERLRIGALVRIGIVAIMLSATHAFGALLVASTSLAFGVRCLLKREYAGFFGWAAIGVAGVSPAAIWYVLNLDYLYIVESDAGPVQRLVEGLEQFARGAITKTFGSNLLLAFIFFFGIRKSIVNKESEFIGIVALTFLIVCFLIQAFVPHIKERAFIVLVPAYTIVCAQILSELETRGGWQKIVQWALPAVMLLSPLLFVGEQFKDREQSGVRALALAGYTQCADTPLPVYIRQDINPAFFEYSTQRVLEQVWGRARIVPSHSIGDGAAVPDPDCGLLAVALYLPRGEREFHELARQEIARIAPPDLAYSEESVGEGRNGGRTRLYYIGETGTGE